MDNIIEWIFEDSKIVVRRGKVKMVIRYPYCDYMGEKGEFMFIMSWSFRFHAVRMLERPKRDDIFNYYRSFSPSKRSIIRVLCQNQAQKPSMEEWW